MPPGTCEWPIWPKLSSRQVPECGADRLREDITMGGNAQREGFGFAQNEISRTSGYSGSGNQIPRTLEGIFRWKIKGWHDLSFRIFGLSPSWWKRLRSSPRSLLGDFPGPGENTGNFTKFSYGSFSVGADLSPTKLIDTASPRAARLPMPPRLLRQELPGRPARPPGRPPTGAEVDCH